MSDFKIRKLDGGKPVHRSSAERRPQKTSKPPHSKPVAKPLPQPEPESSNDDNESEFGGFSEEGKEEEDTDTVKPVETTSSGHDSSARSTSPDADAKSEAGSDPNDDSESAPDPTPEASEESNGKDPAKAQAEDAEQPEKSFQELGLREELVDACNNLGFSKPTPIQAQSIPLALAGRDIIGLAETGSGKTAAFGLPILQALLDKPQPLFGLIMAPTRELAYQIAQQIDALGAIINVRSVTLVGGMDMV